jgi:hypothetical protein
VSETPPPEPLSPGATGLTPGQQALLARRLQGRKRSAGRGGETPRNIPRSNADEAPLSAEQTQLLYHSLLSDRPIYNEAVTFIRHGPTDVSALRRAFGRLVARHEMWRTEVRIVRGEPRQFVQPSRDLELPLHDLRELPESEREPAATQLLASLARPRYDLRRGGPLIRPALVRMSATEHRLLLALHHLAFDGVSLYRVVLPELARLYDAELRAEPDPHPLPVQYVDYALWQRGVLEAELAREVPWWRAQLAGAPAELRLPLAQPRSAERTHRGAVCSFEVPRPVVEAAYSLARLSGATLFPVLMAAYALVLRDHGAGSDLVFATVADLRRRPELQSMVGYCLTPLVLRLQFAAEQRPTEFVAAAHRVLLAALDHVVPFDPLVQRLEPPRAAGADPVFQSMLVLEPPALLHSPEWELRVLETGVGQALQATKTDLHLELDERPTGSLSGRVFINADLFPADYADRFAADFASRLGWLTSVEND